MAISKPFDPLAIIIKAMAITAAIIMTGRFSTTPTAVMTESSDSTASRITICTTTAQKPACSLGPLWHGGSTPSNRSCSSMVLLSNRNSPPMDSMRSRPEKA